MYQHLAVQLPDCSQRMYLLDVDHVYILFCSDNMQEGHNYCIVFPLLLKAIYISVSIGLDRVLKFF